MTRHSSRPVRSFHILLVTVALLLTSTLAASADQLIPAADSGGGGGGGSAATLDEIARSQELIALTPGNSIATSSGDDTLNPATASFEDVQATQNDALAAAELEAATHRNTQSIALLEGRSVVELAGGDQLAAVPQATTPNTAY